MQLLALLDWWLHLVVNQDTIPLAKFDAIQFGKALNHILWVIYTTNPRFDPVYASKIDYSDGFYHINLNPDSITKLALAFPTATGEPQLVALPLILPMGWKNSPPIFCSAVKTIADIANTRIQ